MMRRPKNPLRAQNAHPDPVVAALPAAGLPDAGLHGARRVADGHAADSVGPNGPQEILGVAGGRGAGRHTLRLVLGRTPVMVPAGDSSRPGPARWQQREDIDTQHHFEARTEPFRYPTIG